MRNYILTLAVASACVWHTPHTYAFGGTPNPSSAVPSGPITTSSGSTASASSSTNPVQNVTSNPTQILTANPTATVGNVAGGTSNVATGPVTSTGTASATTGPVHAAGGNSSAQGGASTLTANGWQAQGGTGGTSSAQGGAATGGNATMHGSGNSTIRDSGNASSASTSTAQSQGGAATLRDSGNSSSTIRDSGNSSSISGARAQGGAVSGSGNATVGNLSTGASTATVGNLSTGPSTASVGNLSTGASNSNATVGNLSTGSSHSGAAVGNLSTGASNANNQGVAASGNTNTVNVGGDTYSSTVHYPRQNPGAFAAPLPPVVCAKSGASVAISSPVVSIAFSTNESEARCFSTAEANSCVAAAISAATALNMVRPLRVVAVRCLTRLPVMLDIAKDLGWTPDQFADTILDAATAEDRAEYSNPNRQK